MGNPFIRKGYTRVFISPNCRTVELLLLFEVTRYDTGSSTVLTCGHTDVERRRIVFCFLQTRKIHWDNLSSLVISGKLFFRQDKINVNTKLLP